MAIFRCKMCGGDLVIDADSTVCECEYCGSKQTVPTVQDEGLQGLFNRANVLRMKSEFDKAAEIYEKILQRSETEAEAYWGLILCKYGIEYVEDPQTFCRVPTCHRASYDAVTVDEDYRRAIRYADPGQKALYEQQAAEIDTIQKGIIALAQKEDPYDVFICYKETGEDGKRTQDSVIANDIYHQLTLEGFKVFYAPITLENKLGSEYEPYIFSALNTAKVMLALGTKPEYFNAVWVKNEWSRFLKIMKKDRTKLLIPCFRDMDPYELPEEFSHLQAQDMSKIGFINDLVRGINKIMGVDMSSQHAAIGKQKSEQQPVSTGPSVESLLKRGYLELEASNWEEAERCFNQVLDMDPENGNAYWGLCLKEAKLPKFNCRAAFSNGVSRSRNYYERAKRYAVGETAEQIDAYEKFKIQKKEEGIKAAEEKKKRREAAAEEKRIRQAKAEEERRKIEPQVRAQIDEMLGKIQAYKDCIAENKREADNLEQKRERELKIPGSLIFAKKKIVDMEKQISKLMKSEDEHKEIENLIPELHRLYFLINGIEQKNGNLVFGEFKPYQNADGTPIEWEILKREEDSILVISSEIITVQKYNDNNLGFGGYGDSWEKSTIRAWLNGEFYLDAFSDSEKEKILVSDTASGDRILLLCRYEVIRYFQDAAARRLSSKDDWWLQDKGFKTGAMFVKADGEISVEGTYTNFIKGIRPVMRINIKP